MEIWISIALVFIIGVALYAHDLHSQACDEDCCDDLDETPKK